MSSSTKFISAIIIERFNKIQTISLSKMWIFQYLSLRGFTEFPTIKQRFKINHFISEADFFMHKSFNFDDVIGGGLFELSP